METIFLFEKAQIVQKFKQKTTNLTEGLPQPPVGGVTEQVGQEDEEGEAEVRHGEREDEPVGPVLPQDISLTQQTQDNAENDVHIQIYVLRKLQANEQF